MNTQDLLAYVVVAVAAASLLYGAYTDIRHRTVKSLLFIPLAAAGFAFNYFYGVPELFLIAGILIFLFTFLAPDTYAYEFLAFIFLLISIVAIYLVGFHWGVQLLVISIVFLLGFQERLFGIGDIKAIIALMYASTIYSPLVRYFFTGTGIDYSLMPTSIAILLDISIFAVVFLVYAVMLASRHGTVAVKGQPMAIRYDPELAASHKAAFREGSHEGVRYLIYRIPFIVPIGLGYLLFLAFGFWILLI